MGRQVLCIDFDDCINSYPGWTGEGYKIINGEPVEGAKEAIKALRNAGWLVLIHSVRCGFSGGMAAIVVWLNKHNIMVDGVSSNKPPADLYIDDRAITFDGNWKSTLKKISTFKHWKEKQKNATLRHKVSQYSRQRCASVYGSTLQSGNKAAGCTSKSR